MIQHLFSSWLLQAICTSYAFLSTTFVKPICKFTYPLKVSFKILISLFFILFSAMAAQAQLTEVWAKRYKYISELSSSYNTATALVVDAQGNTYVTGYIIGGGHYNNYDYATI